MALENLSPVVREERLLAGENLEPVTRLEYFLKQAGSGGSGSVEYDPVLAETTKSVNEHGWSTSFSGGPIFEGTSYRVIVNGVTYEPLIGTAGELGYICLGNTYVDDADPTGDYPFGIFYKNDTLTAWLETGESITMQIDQIIQLVPVPTPAAADTGKVLTANNGAVEWAVSGGGSADFLVVKASGRVEYTENPVCYHVGVDKTDNEINACIAINNFVPIYVLFPEFDIEDSDAVFSYDYGFYVSMCDRVARDFISGELGPTCKLIVDGNEYNFKYDRNSNRYEISLEIIE